MPLQSGETIRTEVVDVQVNGIYLRHEASDGFVSAIEMSWNLARDDPRNYLAKGDRIDVLVYAVTEKRFYATIKGLHPERDPWGDPSVYSVGSRHRGTVTNVVSFGAFVDLESGAFGLIPGSCDDHGLDVGQIVTTEVKEVAPTLRRIELRKIPDD